MKKSYYSDKVSNFIQRDLTVILGELSKNNVGDLAENQKKAWEDQICFLQKALAPLQEGYILFEYTIPRLGRRIDNILIYRDVIFILEFKVGSGKFTKQACDQVLDYALDLKNFHEESRYLSLVPILIATKAKREDNNYGIYSDGIHHPLFCTGDNLLAEIKRIAGNSGKNIKPADWLNSRYRPTPTIIEAAQVLYTNHNVDAISRSDSGAKNLTETTNTIMEIIERSKINKEKSICFITGVPGAGKTLAGLNIASQRQNYHEEEHAVFLSGNGPLVDVLREALARDKDKKNKEKKLKIRIEDVRREVESFIQNIYHFRNESLKNNEPSIEKIVIFDEAQRAWTREKTAEFMKNKKFKYSEPKLLVSVMDRHEDWAVIICLVGGGQEINRGEAGISEWLDALIHFPEWKIYASNQIEGDNYLSKRLDNFEIGSSINLYESLHLSVSLRSFRSENLSNFIAKLLENEKERASDLLRNLGNYPIVITRSLETAKKWLHEQSRGNERIGIVASSGGRRLKALGLEVRDVGNKGFDAKNWFLEDKDDIRSSFYLEEVATEFGIQGLELDWVCVAWDADFRYTKGEWEYKNFRGTSWDNMNQPHACEYRKNAYRVLLTRARQGMVVFIPKGDENDYTRLPGFYDGVYRYLKQIGLREI